MTSKLREVGFRPEPDVVLLLTRMMRAELIRVAPMQGALYDERRYERLR
jgi:hypothetical protein